MVFIRGCTKIQSLCKHLKQDSHITLKIRQTINFINIWRGLTNAEKQTFTTRAFEYKEYINHISSQSQLYDIMETLPPPFFNPTIYMDLVTNGIEDGERQIVDLSQISAGQLQYVHTMSNIVYHIENLLSIKEKSRVKYHCVNIMMDEIELCYHPEYQGRSFMNW